MRILPSKMSLRARLSLQTAMIIGLTMVVVASYTYFRAANSVEDLSNRIIDQNASLINQRIDSLLERAEGSAAVAAGLAVPEISQENVQLDSARLAEIAPSLIDLVEVNPEFATAMITIAETGEYLQVTQSATGTIRIEMTVVESGQRVRRLFRRFGSQLQQTQSMIFWDRDPRSEAFFELVEENREIAWTEAYVFHESTLPKTPGVTCGRPIVDQDGNFVGVASIDLTLESLGRFLRTIQVGEQGLAFLVELSPGAEPRVLAHPKASVDSEEGQNVLINVADLGEPATVAFVQQIIETPIFSEDDILRGRVQADGETHLAGALRISGERRPNWMIGITVPSRDYMASVFDAGAVSYTHLRAHET